MTDETSNNQSSILCTGSKASTSCENRHNIQPRANILGRLSTLCDSYKKGITMATSTDRLFSDLVESQCLLEAVQERVAQATVELSSMNVGSPQARHTRNKLAEARSRSRFVAGVATAHWKSSGMTATLPSIVQAFMLDIHPTNTLDRLSSDKSVVTFEESEDSIWPDVSVSDQSERGEGENRDAEAQFWIKAILGSKPTDKDQRKAMRAEGSRTKVVEGPRAAKRQRRY